MRINPALPLTLLSLSLAATPASASDFPIVPEVVASFDSLVLDTPEGIATDYWGNVYVSHALTGEIDRIDRFGNVDHLASLPIGPPLAPCHGFVGGLGAIVSTPWGLYVNVNACDEDDRGIWWVSPHSGEAARVAALPTDAFANGLAHRFGLLYASDSFSGRIWRASAFGGEAEVWVTDPLLDPTGAAPPQIAANGTQFFGGELYVANSATGDIVAFDVLPDQSAGAARVHASLAGPCDDFAFDLFGTLYCGANFDNTVVAVYPDGDTEVVVDGDELDGPSAMAFGRLSDRRTLYITNAAFPFYPNEQNPSVVKIELPIPGWPFR